VRWRVAVEDAAGVEIRSVSLATEGDALRAGLYWAYQLEEVGGAAVVGYRDGVEVERITALAMGLVDRTGQLIMPGVGEEVT
jgi:hypothetical protein